MKFDPHKLVDEIQDGKDDAFQQYLDTPSTKFMLSLIPEGPQDALRSLLQSTFEAGLGYGATAVSASILKIMLDKQSK